MSTYLRVMLLNAAVICSKSVTLLRIRAKYTSYLFPKSTLRDKDPKECSYKQPNNKHQ